MAQRRYRGLYQWITYLDEDLTKLLERVRYKELPWARGRLWKAALLRKIILEWAADKGYMSNKKRRRKKPRTPRRGR
jgi:hypothetical protein